MLSLQERREKNEERREKNEERREKNEESKKTTLLMFQSSIFPLLSSLFYLPSSIFPLLSSLFYLPSSIFPLLSSIFYLLSYSMPGPPVSIGAAVVLTPGAAGPPDMGTIIAVLPPLITANGLPLATSGSICQMINSVTGVPYPMVIGPLASLGVSVSGRSLVRVGDRIPTPPGILTVLGPPAAPFITDNWAP